MENNWLVPIISTIIGLVVSVIFGSVFLLVFSRRIVKWLFARFVKRLMSEEYHDNIWEMVTAVTRINPILIIENSLRSNSGKIIQRPFGSPRKFLNFDGLVFLAAQLHKLPKYGDEVVNTKVIIGPKAKKPLTIDIPLLAAGMGYGVGLSSKVKRAIAKATASLGTATNSGEGAFLFDERVLAKYFILQYYPGGW
jgi:glutamate synthase domain-containing protein 2